MPIDLGTTSKINDFGQLNQEEEQDNYINKRREINRTRRRKTNTVVYEDDVDLKVLTFIYSILVLVVSVIKYS